MNAVNSPFGNLILFLAVLAWAAAQILKLVVTFVVAGHWDWKNILSSGGMPSSHSSTVCAMTSSIAFLYGFSSPLFALGAIVSFVVMYDAFNVRREAGEQARILNYMKAHWEEQAPEDLFSRELKELIGHTPLQVLMGALLGIAVGWVGAWLITG